MNIVELKNVTKSFEESGQKRKILDNVNLAIQAGEFIILKGEMGAGKTTLINLILGLQIPESGTVRVFGYAPEQPESKLKLGLMLQKTRAPGNLKVEETINLIRSFYPKSYSTAELLTRSKLEQKRYSWASSDELSGGEERSLYFALAIAGNPEFLILDEPTTGLDPHARSRVLQQIRDFANEGKTILLVSHIESDADAISDLATRTLTLSHGKIQEVRTDNFEQLQQSISKFGGAYSRSEQPVVKPKNLFSMLLGQTKVELLKLIRQPIVLLSMLALYSVVALFPRNDPNALFYMTGLATINLLIVAIQTLSIQIATERKQGWVKLLRVTPLPAWIYLTSKVIIAFIVSFTGIILMFSLGIFKVGMSQPFFDWVILFFSLILGIVPFAIFGFVIGYTMDANSISLVSAFLIGLAVFSSGSIPLPGMPEWLQNLIPFSPFYHYAQIVMWAGHIQIAEFYNNYLAIHLEWLVWTTCVASFLAIWAYQRNRAIS
ncbi:ABC-2 type transport system permease protein (plasmid) [Tolypothrix tenuis PCC 7101]|uniref:ABC-2 type transport system permease protein n=1 Tax=Tolypothrix tenuis PCC 7101 TaxID=231146 RepID=A0A1Z4NB47_9CYAN|nr:ABC transporter ATP-binding protein/permease [Aulosira sp. FACHB-113]BAZ02905.1 ABC-2 type transport system permease protein [Tolypothrix tenuis PCC 7101]BAZ78172.1 ABC-2 type transport system permease protein [Aulosira laxa NIES-50]